jgi:hypothetical protein
VVGGEGNLDGLITLVHIIAKLVYEPPEYFGDFFNGVIPKPQNIRFCSLTCSLGKRRISLAFFFVLGNSP